MAALAILLWSEIDLVGRIVFVLAWAATNFVGLILLRRPMPVAALSLLLLVVLILLSRFKHDVLLMTINFVDVMIVDSDTVAFLMNIFPALGMKVWIGGATGLAGLAVIWRIDPFRVPRRAAALGAAVCLVALTVLAVVVAAGASGPKIRSANFKLRR